MAYETILYEKSEGVGTITLNRPEVMNALNTKLREELVDALDDAKKDPEIGVVILTGAGERAFSAGMDLKEFAQRQQAPQHVTESRRGRFDRPHPVFIFDKPIIAAVNGLAFGGGTEMALLCDIIVASENASFALAEVKRGIIPGNGGTQRLPRLIGKNRALEMIMTGAPVSAQEAYRMGLANHVVPREQLMEKATEIGRAIMANAPVAVRLAKEAVRRGMDATLEEGLRIEGDMSSFLGTTEDAKEGPRAFVEKRAPQWKGR